MTISVCVPVHDPEGVFASYLEELVSSLAQQDLPPDEVVLAANHGIGNMQTLESIAAGHFKLVFVRSSAKNAPANLNAAVRNCTSDVVKILFQDDLLSAQNSLSSSLKVLQRENSVWCAVKFDHLVDESLLRVRPMVPKFTENLVRGKNKIGAPSVVMFDRKHWIEFDERMVFTFDCDWYLMMNHKWGGPAVDTNLGVAIRLHPGQATHWAREKLNIEISMMKKKHEKLRGGRWGKRQRRCSCIKEVESSD